MAALTGGPCLRGGCELVTVLGGGALTITSAFVTGVSFGGCNDNNKKKLTKLITWITMEEATCLDRRTMLLP